MWGSHYQNLEQAAGLRNVRCGFGVLPTRPAGFAAVGIPLGHCPVSPGIDAVDLKPGPDIGSDHLPLIVELTLQP